MKRNPKTTVLPVFQRRGRSIFVRRNHKDELFRKLFNNKETLLSLYNAVNGTDYTKEEDLTFYTMEDAIYMGYKNDVSFLISSELNLYEHQSSYNPNMPLRGLIYFARQYEAYIVENHLDIYASQLVKLPFPRYVIFYNGPKPLPNGEDQITLKLSDAFQKTMHATAPPALECTATVYNINFGHSREIMNRCRTLAEYSMFLSLVSAKVNTGVSLKQAIDLSVTECIERDVLANYLRKHRAEVVGMILEEFSWKDYKKVVQKSAHDYYQPQIDALQLEVEQQKTVIADKDAAIADMNAIILQLQTQIKELEKSSMN